MAERPPVLPPGFLEHEGLVGGLVAGTVFALLQTVAAPLLGGSPGDPWKAFASVALWRQAVAGPLTLGVFLVGFASHFAIAACLGMIWGFALAKVPAAVRDDWGLHAALATAYGVGAYVLNFQLVGRLIYPWLPEASPFAQLLLHGLAFGLPLGLYLTARLRPYDRFLLSAEAVARSRRGPPRPPP